MALTVMTGLRTLALTALLATPAAAQMPHINMMPDVKSKSAEEREREERAEKAYRDSMRKIPDAKVASDPWGDVRGTDAAKSKAPPKAPSQPSPKNAKAGKPPA